MKIGSVEQAERRLSAALGAFDAFTKAEAAKDIQTARSHWATFLLALGGVYTKLEQGAKCCGACTGWFSHEKGLRKSDELLSYLLHARNCEEHGLDETTVFAPQELKVNLKDTGFGFSAIGFGLVGQDQESPASPTITVGYSDGTTRDVSDRATFTNKQLTLVTIFDGRSKTSHSRPNKHLGQKVEGYSPSVVGKLGLDYVTRMVSAAKVVQCQQKHR